MLAAALLPREGKRTAASKKPGPFGPGFFVAHVTVRPGSDLQLVGLNKAAEHVTVSLPHEIVTHYMTRAMFSSSRWKASRVLPNIPTLLTALRASSAETP